MDPRHEDDAAVSCLIRFYQWITCYSPPPAEPERPTADPMVIDELAGVEGAVMIPVDNKSMFLLQNGSIALSVVHSHREDSISLNTSQCSECHEGKEHSPNEPITAKTTAASTTQRTSAPQPPAPTTQKTVSPLRCNSTTTPPTGEAHERTGMSRRLSDDALNQFNALYGNEDDPTSPIGTGPNHHHHHHHRQHHSHGLGDRNSSESYRQYFSTHGTDFIDYPTEKVDERTRKKCQLYRRRPSTEVYGSSSYCHMVPIDGDQPHPRGATVPVFP